MAPANMAKPPQDKDNARKIAARIREAGKRARAEAEARRATEIPAEPGPAELGGQKGPEPTRYGDWEKKGIVSDF
jgi:hypothetical protein